MAAGAFRGLVAVLETYRGRDRLVSGGSGPAGPCATGAAGSSPGGASAGPGALLWLPAGGRGAGRAAGLAVRPAREPPGRVGPAERLPHGPAPLRRLRHAPLQLRLRAGPQGESGAGGAAAAPPATPQARGLAVPPAPRRTRMAWCGGCRCSATWPTSSTTPASTSPGRLTPASSASARRSGGL